MQKNCVLSSYAKQMNSNFLYNVLLPIAIAIEESLLSNKGHNIIQLHQS